MAYHNQHHHHHHISQDQMALQQHFTALMPEQHPAPADSGAPKPEHHHNIGVGGGPNWLSNAILRSQGGPYGAGDGASAASGGTNFLNLHTNSDSSSAAAASQLAPSQWLSTPPAMDDSSMLPIPPDSEHNDSSNNNGNTSTKADLGDGGPGEVAGVGDGVSNWQNAKYKAEILSHPLYEQLLSAHVSCLKIATPVDQLPRIDSQLAQSQNVVAKYSTMAPNGSSPMVGDDKELDQFMTHYVLLLCSFKEQLQQHVRVHAMEAVMACWEIEQSLQSLTGVSPGEGSGATMSDDEDDPVDSDSNLYDGGLDGHDNMGFGPLIPTESERSLMERVRQELKHELKQGYKEKIVDIREEILRKRRAGKLPGDTTSVLKAWWQSHSKWPYPTEEDKARLVQETGLQLKQINNWFINQRKRNWHSNSSTPNVTKTKRKR
ncbi:hypothetical protein V2J09_022909 [Rumex salicifolius]